MTTFEHVISSHRDRNVIQIAIQRPDKRNALASAHWAALEAALDEAAVSDAHILVLSGVPGAFCAGADIDELKVKTIMVDEGPTLKRFMARAKGRGTRILKRTSHITVVVGEGK